MTDETTQALLPVTQADRDAAASINPQYFNTSTARAANMAETAAIKNGSLDHHENVQAFARHRTAHSLPSQADEGLVEVLERVVDWCGERGADDQLLPAEAQPEWIADAMRALSVSRKFRETGGGRCLADYRQKHADYKGAQVAGQAIDAIGRPATLTSPPTSDAGECETCGGAGQVFGHADDCVSDLCALNGDMDSCDGKVEPCHCLPPTSGEEMRLRTINHEIRDDLIAAAPETVTFEDLIAWLSTVRHFSWTWTANTRCKYVDIRIDTRRGAFAILDRDGNKITLDELRHQHRAALTKGAE